MKQKNDGLLDSALKMKDSKAMAKYPKSAKKSAPKAAPAKKKAAKKSSRGR